MSQRVDALSFLRYACPRGFTQVKEQRDLERARRRYMKLTKSELIELLIQSEQYIAQNNKLWLKDELEKYSR
jgi:hypothetical protein